MTADWKRIVDESSEQARKALEVTGPKAIAAFERFRRGMTLRLHGVDDGSVDVTIADVEELPDGSVRLTPEP